MLPTVSNIDKGTMRGALSDIALSQMNYSISYFIFIAHGFNYSQQQFEMRNIVVQR